MAALRQPGLSSFFDGKDRISVLVGLDRFGEFSRMAEQLSGEIISFNESAQFLQRELLHSRTDRGERDYPHSVQVVHAERPDPAIKWAFRAEDAAMVACGGAVDYLIAIELHIENAAFRTGNTLYRSEAFGGGSFLLSDK